MVRRDRSGLRGGALHPNREVTESHTPHSEMTSSGPAVLCKDEHPSQQGWEAAGTHRGWARATTLASNRKI